MVESDWTTLRVRGETKERVNALTQYGTQDTIIQYLLDQNDKVNLFNPGWARKVAEEQLQEILSDMDIEFRKKVELENHRARLKSVQRVFDEYLKILPREEKKDWLENILGDTKSGNFLENMTNYQMFLIDGQKRLLMPVDDGFPKIPGVSRDRIISCERGFHIQSNRCDCRYWKECPLGEPEFLNWLGKYGSEFQRKKYLEETTGETYFVRRSR